MSLVSLSSFLLVHPLTFLRVRSQKDEEDAAFLRRTPISQVKSSPLNAQYLDSGISYVITELFKQD